MDSKYISNNYFFNTNETNIIFMGKNWPKLNKNNGNCNICKLNEYRLQNFQKICNYFWKYLNRYVE